MGLWFKITLMEKKSHELGMIACKDHRLLIVGKRLLIVGQTSCSAMI